MADIRELRANAGGDSSPLRHELVERTENVPQVARHQEDASRVREALAREALIKSQQLRGARNWGEELRDAKEALVGGDSAVSYASKLGFISASCPPMRVACTSRSRESMTKSARLPGSIVPRSDRT